MYSIAGHHHISMITKNAKQNSQFYRDILGLRRVKITVNQDDPSMYHLFYGDKAGSVGTELSFFEIPPVGRTYRGTNAITQIGLLVSTEASLLYWQSRFEKYGVRHTNITTYANKQALHFKDPEGLRFVLLVANGDEVPNWQAWERTSVPEEHQIRGMGSIEIMVRNLDKLAEILTEVFGYSEESSSEDEIIFQSIRGKETGEIVAKSLDGPNEKPGRGSIHHLALRVKDEIELAYWEERLREYGFHSSSIIDRFYFKSLYFRESNGILFELATDGPGFTIDRDVNSLGEQLDLPTFLEDQRAEIEEKLEPID